MYYYFNDIGWEGRGGGVVLIEEKSMELIIKYVNCVYVLFIV